LGGLERLSRLDSWIVEGSGRENLSAELQGLSPDAPTWRPHDERVAVLRAAGTVAWERRTPRNDQSLRWRRFIYKPDAFAVVDWTSGSGSMRPTGSPASAREALMRRVPHVLLLEAATRATRAMSRGEWRLAGAGLDVVEVALPDETVLTLLFAKDPALLASAEYRLYLPGLGDVMVAWQWHGWKKHPRLGFAPSGHLIDVDGTTFQEVEYSRYEADPAAAAALTIVPANLTPRPRAGRDPPPPAGSSTGEVAPGVWIVEAGGFLAMFVEFRDFVVVFDAPASGAGLEAIPASGRSGSALATNELLAAIARECPGKPVRYLILSHHHGDHLGGARGFAGRGVTILAAPAHVAAARRALEAPHALAPDSWSGPARETLVEAVSGRRVVTDGNRRLEVINVGENPHTTESLIAWLPEERLLLQGDLFYYAEGEPFPPAGRETMNRFFARWLSARGIAPRAVYGVHYPGAAPPEALARAAGPDCAPSAPVKAGEAQWIPGKRAGPDSGRRRALQRRTGSSGWSDRS
ncbi:MAG: MBL fold metallo-hydrolase, partial [Thermoanaerobaculia bacterium]